MYKVWEFLFEKRAFAFLVIITLTIFGAFSLVQIPKESSPEVQVPVGIVSTFLPGASAEDVEKLVTNEVEKALFGSLESLNTLTSSSRESISVVVAEFDANADLDKSIRELRDEVDAMKGDLPDDAEDPTVSEISFVDEPVTTFTVSGDLSDQEFTILADALEDDLTSLSGVSRVEVAGARAREAHVVVDREALARFNIGLSDIVAALSASNASQPIGSISIDGVAYNVSFEGDINDPRELNDIAILSVSGRPIFVRDIGTIVDGLEEAETLSRVSVDGEPSKKAVSFNVFKETGGDITEVTTTVSDRLEVLQGEGRLLSGLTVLTVFDRGDLLAKDLRQLSFTGLQTILLVMVLLLFTIGWRESLLAGIAIPLSFLIAFIGLFYSGNTLNFVSLFALILSVGVLVDSAIVMVEGIHTNMKEKMDKREAAKKAVREFYLPLTAGTMTTVAVFAALFMISGVTGEFIATIPFTIIFLLIASLFVALGLLPLFASFILRRRSMSRIEERQEEYAEKLREHYRRFMRSIIGNKKRERRVIWGLILAFLLTLSMPFVGLVGVEFFAAGDSDFMQVDVELPQGTELSKTDIEVRRIEELLYEEQEFASFLATVGQSSLFGDGTLSPHLGNFFINLKEDRDRTSLEIIEALQEKTKDIKTAEVRVSQPEDGPPTGAPILIQFFGENLDDLERVAVDAKRTLESIDGTRDIISSADNVASEFVLKVDSAKATALGLNPRSVAQTLRIAVEGSTATTIRRLEEDIDVRVVLALNPLYEDVQDTNETTIDAIRQIPLQTPNGPVLLGSVLTTGVQKSNSTIRHEDRERILSVSADVTAGANAIAVTREFERVFDTSRLPTGITMRIGGENEDVQQSFQDMFVALGLGVVLMLAMLVLQFNSYRYAIYILSVVPFSLIGIFIGLAITGRPISFPSMMGFVALAGIVVNNSIILIDVINNLRRNDPSRSIADIVIEGSSARLRPIILTTVTTIAGMIPLTFVSELWAPLAFAVMFGLISAVFSTLLLVPVIYSKWPGKLSS